MIDLQTTEHGFTEVNPPTLVRDNALFGTGQLPKFGDDLFRTTAGHWLVPTAEVTLTNLVAGDILEGDRRNQHHTRWPASAVIFCFGVSYKGA